MGDQVSDDVEATENGWGDGAPGGGARRGLTVDDVRADVEAAQAREFARFAGMEFRPFPRIAAELDGRERREMRERALSAATYVHQDVGDAMITFNREDAVSEILATADRFYDWIVAP